MAKSTSMLEGAPWLLAHKSMLKVNEPFRVSLYGKDYVLWKDARGQVEALPNACPHMGAMLAEGWCEVQADGSSKVVCPFHALEFDGAGCTHLPGSGKETQSLLEPLDLMIQGDLIWSYGGCEPQREIPNLVEAIAQDYELIGITTDTSIATPLLPMLLNMHDYNHQNGTHRDLFSIEEVHFQRFIDNGHQSHAFYNMPTAKPGWREIRRNPSVLMVPSLIEAHLENHFPSLVLLHAQSGFGEIKQCHIFVPESENRTRTYVLVFGRWKNPLFSLMSRSIVDLVNTVVQQDAEILARIYSEQPQRLKLNNEVGMDWVRRNYKSWPAVTEPGLSMENSERQNGQSAENSVASRQS